MTPEEIVKRYLGIPYTLYGRGPETMDCWGLILAVYSDLGFSLWDPPKTYKENWAFKGDNHFIENYHWDWEQVDSPTQFDVVLFNNGQGVTSHGGVMLDTKKFLHCCKPSVVVSRLSDPAWENKLQGFYHLRARK